MKRISLKAGFECLEARHCLSATLNLALAGEAENIVDPEVFAEAPIYRADYSNEVIGDLDAVIPLPYDLSKEATAINPVSVHEDLGFIKSNAYEAVVSDSVFPSGNPDPIAAVSAFEVTEQTEVYFEVSSRPEFWLINDFATFEYYSSFSVQHVIFVVNAPHDAGNDSHSLQRETAHRPLEPSPEQLISIPTSVVNSDAVIPIAENSGSLQEDTNRVHPELAARSSFDFQQPRVTVQPSANSGIAFAATGVARYRSIQTFDQIEIDPSKVNLDVDEMIQSNADSKAISAVQASTGSVDSVQSNMEHVAATLAKTSIHELLDFAALTADGPFGSRILEFTSDHVDSVFEMTSIDRSATGISSVARLLAMVSNQSETSDSEESLYGIVASSVIGGIGLFAFHRNRKQTLRGRQQTVSPIPRSTLR